jgi:hypothetical protein
VSEQADMGRDDQLEPRVADQHAPWFDVTEGFYDLGQGYAADVPILSALDEDFGDPVQDKGGADLAALEPRSYRLHDLQKVTPYGSDDRRLSVQVWDDYEAEYADADPRSAPFGQTEWITPKNRSTRVADNKGRVAVHSSHRRLIDSEDERYALALTMREIGFGETPPGGTTQPDATDDVGGGLPPGVSPFEAGIQETEDGRRISRASAGISIGGVTIFGEAAKQAALDALARGGSVQDAQRWAIAAAQGTSFPPLLDADPDGGEARAEPPPPDLNPGGSVGPLERPAGYVTNNERIGLLGTVFTLEGVAGSYFAGRDETAIGPMAIRDDAQFSAGPEQVGRLHMKADEDAAGIEFAAGRKFKGWLGFDTSLANVDTEVGLETGQWPVIVPVTADVPPSKPPPPIGIPGGGPTGTGPVGVGGGPKGGPAGGGPPGGPGSGGGGDPEGEGPDDTTGGGGDPETPVRIGHDPIPGEDPAPEVSMPGGQARDFESPGTPCPNSTAGVLVGGGGTGTPAPTPGSTTNRPSIVVGSDGGARDMAGYPAFTKVPGGVAVGGIEGLPFGLPGGRPPRGFDVGPADDTPGNIPLGLPGGAPSGGFDVEPGPDQGIPHRGEERARAKALAERRAEAEARRKAQQEAGDKKRQDEIDRLEGSAKFNDKAAADARAEGDSSAARRAERKARRARRKAEEARKRDERIKEKRQKREDYKNKKKAEKERRKKAKKERSRKRKEARKKRLEEARRKKKEREEQDGKPKGDPEGAWLIDTTPVGFGEPAISVGDVPQSQAAAIEAQEETSNFGDWNVANMPIPALGGPDGMPTLEVWTHYATHAMRAQQAILLGAFGGPGYLASNIAVRHENTPGNPPASSSIGSHWTAYPGESIFGTPPAVEFVSILEAQPGSKIRAGYDPSTPKGPKGGPIAGAGNAGGEGENEGPESNWAPPFQFVREFRGGGTVEDDRPLVVLVNDKGAGDGISVGPMISGDGGRFEVDEDSGIAGGSVTIYGYPGEDGNAFTVGGARPTSSTNNTPDPSTQNDWVYIDNSEGALNVTTGLQVKNGALITLFPEGTEATGAEVGYTADGTLLVSETSGAITMTVSVDGDVNVTGDTNIDGKLTVAGSIDPTDLQLTKQSADPIPVGEAGIWVSDGTVGGTSDDDLVYTSGNPQVRQVIGTAGGATDRVRSLSTEAAAASTTSGTETTLHAYTLPDGTLDNDGDSIEITIPTSTINSGSLSGTYRIYFGATSVTYGVTSTSQQAFRVTITRRAASGAGAQYMAASVNDNGGGGSANHLVPGTQPAETVEGGAGVVIKITGQVVLGAGTLQSEQMAVRYQPAA